MIVSVAKKGYRMLNKQGMIGKVVGFAGLAWLGRWAFKKFTQSSYAETSNQGADDALSYSESQAEGSFAGEAEIIAQQMWGVLGQFLVLENPFEALIPMVEGLTEQQQHAVYVAFGVREMNIWGEGDLFAFLAAADGAWWSIWGPDLDDFYEVFTIGKAQ